MYCNTNVIQIAIAGFDMWHYSLCYGIYGFAMGENLWKGGKPYPSPTVRGPLGGDLDYGNKYRGLAYHSV